MTWTTRMLWVSVAALISAVLAGRWEHHLQLNAAPQVVDERVECIGGDRVQRQECENSLARMRDAVPLATYQIYTVDCGLVSCCLVPDE